ncbi:hypothetical protein DNTS_006736 [Danionella cerebrum]|uniref:Ig-like domain-containing protein n=1 Tax=Danionella cerebrum TaxID=2873325 RepID=A0A553NLE2_9TELE|nr:hypothetical protein DNTS_006736 [Danionella translucida]
MGIQTGRMGQAWLLSTALLLLAIARGCSKLVITPEAAHLVILKGEQLHLRCHDDAESSRGRVRWIREKGRRIEGELKEPEASVILLNFTQTQHMGNYTCENTETREKSFIYVYVKDFSGGAFVRRMVNDLQVRKGEDITLPCLVTDPAVRQLSLQTCNGSSLPATLSYITHPQGGITIRNVSKSYEGCYLCAGVLDGKDVKSSQYNLVVRLVPETVPVISLSRTENMILIQDQEFKLSCSSININHDFDLRWSIPSEVKPEKSQKSNIQPGSGEYQRSITLWIKSVKMNDTGVYRCNARNEKGTSVAAVNLEVYESGFINLTEGEDQVVEVREGESLTLAVEMTSYPKPTDLYWTYNNQELKNTSEHVITLYNQQYRYISELRLVRVHGSEGGVYTFSASHDYASVNHSFIVHVLCKPAIVSQEGPLDGQVRCVASGYPVPKISWYYCELPHTRCSHLVNATQADEEVAMVTVSGPEFGRSEVESRLNITKGKFHTLECVANTQGEQAFTLYEVMRWCWSADPLKRPTFKKLLERTELLLSESTKHDYLNLSTSGSCEVFIPPGLQRAQRLSSVGSSTASTQPLLLATNDVFLEQHSI